ncbi:MAG TPA: 2-oxoacid:acceptor oxidoreductase subunit alpha, partial [Proteobacteria bacterium]|nr:2-oxoacid:acceptor oxidoreductase subunit alpha [Pseudomonadota bacterium]
MRKVPSDPFYKHGVQFISGNEAIAEGAIYAGCRFFAGYPITPSTEIAEHLSKRLPAIDGVFLQMEDEIASIAAVLGASIAGVKSMTATSGPGFSLMQENIGYGYMAEIPCVIVDVMRGGPSTGTPTGPSQSDVMQAKWGTHGDHPVIAIAPYSVQECFVETVRAFNLSEQFRLPVIVLSDEIISHMREKVVLPKHGEIELVDR